MKFLCILAVASFSTASAFVGLTSSTERALTTTKQLALLPSSVDNSDDNNNNNMNSISRHDFFQTAAASMLAVPTAASVMMTMITMPGEAQARGRATLEQAYRKFTPRIRAGGEFYSVDMKKLVGAADFEGVKNALQEPPARKKEDLTKSDSGVAARARQAGQFSDARVLVAADLFASAFSESSISAKTKTMQAAVAKMRAVVEEMESVSRQALGEEGAGGGLFGFGAKKVDKSELAKRLRNLYVEGGNAYNEYVLAANDNLALQFDKLSFIK